MMSTHRASDDTGEMAGIEDTLAAATRLLMTRHFKPALEHPHHSGAHLHRHARADQAPGHAVLVGVDLDRGLGVDLAAQFPDLMIGRTPLQRLQTGGLDPREPVDRPLAGRAMDAQVGGSMSKHGS
jgi:hypothetical protein